MLSCYVNIAAAYMADITELFNNSPNEKTGC